MYIKMATRTGASQQSSLSNILLARRYTAPAALAGEFGQEELLLFRQEFSAADRDDDGDIPAGQLVQVMNRCGEAATLARLEALGCAPVTGNGSGSSVTFEAFLGAMLAHRRAYPPVSPHHRMSSSSSSFNGDGGSEGQAPAAEGDANGEGNAAIAAKEEAQEQEEEQQPQAVAIASPPPAAGSTSPRKQLQVLQGMGGASHSFSEEEKAAFAEHINAELAEDPHVQRHLPIDPASPDALFAACADGLVFCKLINLASPDTVDERVLNTKPNMSAYHKIENNNLAVNAARALGCVVTNIGAKDLLEGRPTLVLGLLWQIIKIQLLSTVSLQECPELVRLLEEGEELESFLCLPPEDILLRWLNFHLAAAGTDRRVGNFGSDLADAECYALLLHQLNPQGCPLPPAEASPLDKAKHVIKCAGQMGVPSFLQPTDILQGNKRLNLGFCAHVFNRWPGLAAVTEEEFVAYDFAALETDDFDAGDTREERTFRMWINSLGLRHQQRQQRQAQGHEEAAEDGSGEIHVHNLFADLADGVVLLKVMDAVSPGIVDWRKVNCPAKNRYKQVENANLVVAVGKKMSLVLVNVGGLDIVDKSKKLILAIVWQLMRRYVLNLLSRLGRDEAMQQHDVTEEEIVAWANATVQAAGRQESFTGFRDASLADSRFLIALCAAIEPRAVNWDLVADGAGEEGEEAEEQQDWRLGNARYAINLARKLGACVFIVPEDVVEVRSKMLMTFVASLWAAAIERRNGRPTSLSLSQST